MTTKKKAAGLDALKNFSIDENEEVRDDISSEAEIIVSVVTKKTKPFALHLPIEGHEALRELSFHSRTSITKLVLEGIDLMFQKRGMPTMDELKKL